MNIEMAILLTKVTCGLGVFLIVCLTVVIFCLVCLIKSLDRKLK